MYVLLCVSCDAFLLLVFLFFQAEDGIRDLVRSRGLGDVYKRQRCSCSSSPSSSSTPTCGVDVDSSGTDGDAHGTRAVSYTHLTLPTSDLV